MKDDKNLRLSLESSCGLSWCFPNSIFTGILNDGIIDPKRSAEAIAKVALTYAEAGADVVAPSDMMDCRIGAIKQKLLV